MVGVVVGVVVVFFVVVVGVGVGVVVVVGGCGFGGFETAATGASDGKHCRGLGDGVRDTPSPSRCTRTGRC